MAGLIKAKKYDWTDSNLAAFGSDDEKRVKKESAESEPAWEGAGKEPGLKIWRINKFQVEDWPEEDYGDFYNGDSYIILNTYKDDDNDGKLLYDVHFWIGSKSTQDEYGTAAYKTVELDTLLDDVPVQHREIEQFESDLFKSYFKTITIMEGGCDSGFNHVEEEAYTPRLLHFKRFPDKHIEVIEVPYFKSCVNDEDVYILDLGPEILQYNGVASSGFERSEAAKYCQGLESKRNGRASASVLEQDEKRKILTHLPEGEPEGYEPKPEFDNTGILYKVSETDGEFDFSAVINGGPIQPSDLDSNDAFIVHVGLDVIVWYGSNASGLEKRNGFHFADKYMRDIAKFMCFRLTVANEGSKCPQLDNALAASCA